MKQFAYLWLALFAAGLFLQSCDDTETYSDQKDKERKAINSFISNDVTLTDSVPGNSNHAVRHIGKINVISEEQFYAQDSTTNLANNEYVLFNSTGVYMQIVRKGTGEKMKSGDQKTLLCRFLEYNIMEDVITARNDTTNFVGLVGVENMTKVSVIDSYGTFAATFPSASTGYANALPYIYNVLYQYTSTLSVPAGWLVPLSYIKVGRQTTADEQIAKVRLIVPHTQGHNYASDNVRPFFYELTYQEER